MEAIDCYYQFILNKYAIDCHCQFIMNKYAIDTEILAHK